MSQPPDQPNDDRPAGDGAPPPPPNPYGTPSSQPPNPYGTPPANPYGTPPADPYGTPPPADPYGGQPQQGYPSYGTPPADPNNPYGTGYGAPPPAYPGYGQQYSPYGQAPGSPESSSLRTQSIVSLVVNIVAVVFCCGIFSIGGAICAGIAMSKADMDPQGTRKLLRWSWGLLIANVIGWILVVVGFIALGVASESSSGY